MIAFEEESQEPDWRARRAELLVGSEAGWVAQLARNKNPAFKNVDVWCHALDTPEPGAVLIADPKMGHFQQHCEKHQHHRLHAPTTSFYSGHR